MDERNLKDRPGLLCAVREDGTHQVRWVRAGLVLAGQEVLDDLMWRADRINPIDMDLVRALGPYTDIIALQDHLP